MHTDHDTDEPQEPRRLHGDGGFTLIELLLVIAILGVLSAVAIFSVSGITDRGERATCVSTKATLTTASQAYRMEEGSFATSLNALVPDYLVASNQIKGGGLTWETTEWQLTYNPTDGSVTGTCPQDA